MATLLPHRAVTCSIRTFMPLYQQHTGHRDHGHVKQSTTYCIALSGLGTTRALVRKRRDVMLLLILLLILILAAVPAWPYSREWGYYPSGGLGTVLVVLVVLMLLGFIHI